MTGSDIADWIAGILDDLQNLGSADVPLLLVKLGVLWVALFFAWQLGRWAGKGAWKIAEPVLLFAWRVVTAPVWLPWRGLQRLVVRPIGRLRRERRWRRDELAKAEQLRAAELLTEAERQRQLDDIKKVLDDL